MANIFEEAVRTGSIILQCTCEFDFQDKKYGKQKRLHTVSKKFEQARCTVCGSKKKLT